MSIFYRFRDIDGYLSKVADFDPPHLHLAPPQGVTPVEFRGDLWRQKTRLLGLSCGVICVILRLAIFCRTPTYDRRTETDTDTAPWLVSRDAIRKMCVLELRQCSFCSLPLVTGRRSVERHQHATCRHVAER